MVGGLLRKKDVGRRKSLFKCLGTVDFRTIGGNAKAVLGYPTTHQILVAEE